MNHDELKDAVRLSLGKDPDVTIHNNPSGVGWQGRLVKEQKHQIRLEHPRRIKFGLVTGASDLIGYVSVLITPEMVGRRVAVFLAPEIKVGADTMSAEQAHFHDMVKLAGGIAVECRAVGDAEQAIEDWKAGR